MTTTEQVIIPNTERLNMVVTNSTAYKAMVKLQLASTADVDPVTYELIKIRASQLNGCAYCLYMHTSDATKMGVPAEKLHMVAAWHEARHFFTKRELLALEFTETVTKIGDHGVPEELFSRLQDEFSDVEIGQLLTAIIMINVWNRVSITSGKPAGTDERVTR